MRLVGHLGGNNDTGHMFGISPTDGSRLERVFSLIACHAQLLYPESETFSSSLSESQTSSRLSGNNNIASYDSSALEHNRDEALLAIAGIVLLLAFGLLLWVCAMSGPGTGAQGTHHIASPVPQYHVSQQVNQLGHQVSDVSLVSVASSSVGDSRDEVVMHPISNSSSWQLDPDQAEALAPFAPVKNSPYKTETLGQYHLEP